VRPDDLNLVAFTDMGVKRIVVTATRDGREMACLVAYRTSAGHETSAALLAGLDKKVQKIKK